jgi:endonuclease/exonuclease/phosphatase family metal-dependent hydrolase
MNMVAAMSLLVAYLAVHISPEKFAIPAFFGLAYPYILFLNIGFLIFWAVNLRKEAFISLLVIIIGINHLNNYIQFGGDDISDHSFSLLSYNLRLFNHYEEKEGSETNVIDLFNQESPEIICLQEFYLDINHADIKRNFTSKLEKSYNVHIKSIYRSGKRFYGIVTLSSFPIINRGDIIHPNSSSLSIFTDIVIGKDTVRVYNNHLQSFRLRRIENSFIAEMSGVDQNDIMRQFRSLSSTLKQGFVQRAIQSGVLREHIENSPYPVIVCGDFNDTPVSYSYRKIRKDLRDAFVDTGSGAGFTYRDKYPPNRIDYILYDPALDCSGFKITRVKYSDHYPISAYFKTGN